MMETAGIWAQYMSVLSRIPFKHLILQLFLYGLWTVSYFAPAGNPTSGKQLPLVVVCQRLGHRTLHSGPSSSGLPAWLKP